MSKRIKVPHDVQELVDQYVYQSLTTGGHLIDGIVDSCTDQSEDVLDLAFNRTLKKIRRALPKVS